MLNLALDVSETQMVRKGYLNHIDIECHRDIIHQNNMELLHLREKSDKNNQKNGLMRKTCLWILKHRKSMSIYKYPMAMTDL
ncbi:hypothetical protein CgunFtcFv8_026897 [Champsocephalus gunnari]|uniref:Uncharacterized protein n=1 Tax=Champsocephalus gunnari TaxID=52237 RepID=A0AAN8HVR2_CHAGU|nr:hypothetical protein CgunFtcFv8_026897 [Champsocephalus gunnari]